jgi:DNA-binding MarR family transcriptional regulator
VEFKHFEDNSLNPESILRNIVEIVTGMVSLIPEIPELEDMSTTELYVFLFSAMSDKVSNGTLSKQLNISKAAVSIATKSLIKKGLIKTIQSEEDRRHFYIVLSDKGKSLYKKLLKAFEYIFNKILSLLSKEELSNLQLGFDVMVRFSRMLNEYKMIDRGDKIWS